MCTGSSGRRNMWSVSLTERASAGTARRMMPKTRRRDQGSRSSLPDGSGLCEGLPENSLRQTDDFIHVVKLYPELAEQTMEGFGGAFTEAAAVCYDSLTAEAAEDFVESCFGESGLKYNLGRLHMNSCDFALGNYTYIEEGDTALKSRRKAEDGLPRTMGGLLCAFPAGAAGGRLEGKISDCPE